MIEGVTGPMSVFLASIIVVITLSMCAFQTVESDIHAPPTKNRVFEQDQGS
jgi:hypothetical protein